MTLTLRSLARAGIAALNLGPISNYTNIIWSRKYVLSKNLMQILDIKV